MNKHSLPGFDKLMTKNYDQNSFMVSINQNMHDLKNAILNDLPSNARILCLGAGTEVIVLAEAFPEFTFVAVEPSDSMLEVCKDKFQKLNLLDRCRLIHGYVQDLPDEDGFDAALCLLVLHHTSKDGSDRQKIIAAIESALSQKDIL